MNRVYLDVTSACQSRLNTGVKRIQRGLHSWLAPSGTYQPVYWQSALREYRKLTPGDRRNLEQTSGDAVRGLALYDSFAPGLVADWTRLWSDRDLRFDWPRELRPGDLLLVPDLVWDNRSAFFRRACEPKVIRVGIFHDAIALRHRHQSRIDALFCGRGVRALAHFDRVVCVSREAEEDLHFFWKKFGDKPVPTHVVPWPVPFAQARPESQPNFEAKELLCVARLEPHKNHLRLLDACEQLWASGLVFRLRLIGCKAYPDAAWKILRRVETLQAAGHDVTWRAHVSDAVLHEAYRTCSFTVFPSLIEGFGLPIIESLWHGRPVVCGANGALGEVATGGGCETVVTTDTDSLAAGLRHLLIDPLRYEQLFQAARSREARTWKQYWTELVDGVESRSA